MSSESFTRNLFEIENARNLTRDEVVQTFVPNQTFWRMLSPKHHVLLGSRGSGKTAVAKMLSHDHLAKWDDPKTQKAIEAKAFIGLYVPTRLEWVGGLRNKPWQTPSEKEQFFRWKFNVATCLSFLVSAESCLNAYMGDDGSRARAERALCKELSAAWLDGAEFDTLTNIHKALEHIEHAQQIHMAKVRAKLSADGPLAIGLPFDIELLSPLRRAIAAANRVFSIPENAAWLLCLDEAEFLEADHIRIINSHMRAHSGNLFFKITTIPYSHHLETNTQMSLDAGHDFEYVYLDRDPVFLERAADEKGQIGTDFGRKLFRKRASISGRRYTSVTLHKLLGDSELLDPTPEDWQPGSTNETLLLQYGSPETIKRALALRGTPQFQSQIGRKLHGALMLRHAVTATKGRRELDVYSGARMAMRCGDANPRRLIRIFNAMLLASKWNRGYGEMQPVTPRKQTALLIQFSEQILSAVQSEPKVGAELYQLIDQAGAYMRHALHDLPLTTDQVSSIWIDENIPDELWRLVERAVALGLLYPNVNQNNPDELPHKRGTFHLAYALAPNFRLLPRRGKARGLATIERYSRTGQDIEAPSESHENQLTLFEDDE